MLIELHAIQSLPPSNVNRDENGAPKDCVFGGARRTRISSQSLKRAIRTHMQATDSLIPTDRLGVRTRRLHTEIARHVEVTGVAPERADALGRAALEGLGLRTAGDGELSEYLVFLGQGQIAALAKVVLDHQAEITDDAVAPKALKDALRDAFSADHALSVALFGRMIADDRGTNVDAAAQVAHAISTHRTASEFDFYTAVDDLNPAEESGAGMIGTIEFVAPCVYRYANLDVSQLAETLDGDDDLVRVGVSAYLTALIESLPSGKQNTFAAHTPPAFILAVVREGGLWNLANAFERPVVPRAGEGLVGASIDALANHWARMLEVYGAPEGLKASYAGLDPERPADMASADRLVTAAALVDSTVEAALAMPGTN